jgi:hypothetical protein
MCIKKRIITWVKNTYRRVIYVIFVTKVVYLMPKTFHAIGKKITERYNEIK